MITDNSKILIAIPCMDTVPYQFAQSLALLQKVGQCSVLFLASSLIYDARNRIANEAIKGGYDFIFWLDSDMVFQPDTLYRLVKDVNEKNRHIVVGNYMTRRAPYRPTIFKTIEEGKGADEYMDYPMSEIFDVAACGFGCVLLDVNVLRAMFLQCGDYFTPMQGFGEDLSFCIRARKCGYKIYCDSRIKLGHVGHLVITEPMYERGEA